MRRSRIFLFPVLVYTVCGCSIASKRTSFRLDEQKNLAGITKSCEKTGRDGDNVNVAVVGNTKLKIKVNYGDGPAFIGPLLVPLIPLRFSDDFNSIFVQILDSPNGINLNYCRWTITTNDSNKPIPAIKNLDGSGAGSCEYNRLIKFVVAPSEKIESISLNIPELDLAGRKSKAVTVNLSAKQKWIYYPLVVMADQLGFPGAPYYCEQ